jgi:hypothetical protein
VSVEVMSWAFDHSNSTGTARLVLLVIANHASADGTNSWPSISTLAKKANVTDAAAKRAIRKLVDLGELEVELQKGGTPEMRDDRRPNRYKVVMGGENGGTQTDPRHGGSLVNERGVAGDDLRGVAGVPLTVLKNKPSLKPSSPLLEKSRELCEHLAQRISEYNGLPLLKVDDKWIDHMRLLMEKGPTSWKTPKPISPEVVRRGIDYVFDHLCEPSQGSRPFCWADNIRCPRKLREKWPQLVEAKDKRERLLRESREHIPIEAWR